MSSSGAYQRLPTREPPTTPSVQQDDIDDFNARYPTPSAPLWQRTALIIFVIFLHYLAWRLFPVGTKPVEDEDTP